MIDNSLRQSVESLVTSPAWLQMKEEIITPFITDIKDATKPIRYGEITVSPEKAAVAKYLAAKKMEELIETLETMKPRQSSASLSEKYD